MTTTLAPHAPLADLLPAVHAFLKRTPTLLIGGRWVPAASGETFPTHNPADGSVLAHIAAGDKEDVNRAARAARDAFQRGPWSRMSGSERGKLLWRLADLIDANAEELAQLETLDNGKPLRVARASDIPGSAEIFRYMAPERFSQSSLLAAQGAYARPVTSTTWD
jgi:phenylacetaldehyde dehydrogenase